MTGPEPLEAGPSAPAAPVRRRPGTSGWAVTALVFAVSVFCPPATMIAPLLGVRALFDIAALPGRRGRGMAVAAIVIGLTATAGWIGSAFWVHATIRRPLLDGPAAAIRAGQAGDVARFRASFTGSAGELEAAAFVSELSRRYGRLVAVVARPAPTPVDAARTTRPVMQAGRVPAWYLLTFEAAEVEAFAPFVVFEGGRLETRFASLEITDPDRGDLAWPPVPLPP